MFCALLHSSYSSNVPGQRTEDIQYLSMLVGFLFFCSTNTSSWQENIEEWMLRLSAHSGFPRGELQVLFMKLGRVKGYREAPERIRVAQIKKLLSIQAFG